MSTDPSMRTGTGANTSTATGTGARIKSSKGAGTNTHARETNKSIPDASLGKVQA